MRGLRKIVVSAVLSCAAMPAYVHHSGAMFDGTREQKLVGTVVEFLWTNPHSSFKLDVVNAAGKVDTWAVEMNSPQNLQRAGWKRSTLKAGDRITAIVHPLRDGKPGGSYVSVTLADGTTLGGSGPGQNSAAYQDSGAATAPR